MKNKKIILGLGTITALGAMSVGFIACVKKKEIEDMNLSKLTKEEVAKLLEKVSTLSKEEVAKLLEKVSTLSKEDVKSLMNEHPIMKSLIKSHIDVAKENFTKEVLQHLSADKDDKINIGHFKRNSTVQDVINKIKELIQTKTNWELVEDSNKEAKNEELLENDKQPKFKFKTKFFDHDIETHEIEFNFKVGRFDFGELVGDKPKVKNVASLDELLKELNANKFKNINLSNEDLEIVGEITPATKDVPGKIKVKVKNDSIKLKQDSREFEFEFDQKKTMLTELTHLNSPTIDWTKTEAEIKAQILKKINEHNDFKDNNLTENDDLVIEVKKPLHSRKGSITIQPKATSKKVKGGTIKLETNKLSPITLEKKHLGTGFVATNTLTKKEILIKLIAHNDLKGLGITEDDFIFEITMATNKTKGTINIKASKDSIIISGSITEDIAQLT